MALSEAPSRDEVIASIQALPGVESFEWDADNNFRCVTVTPWTTDEHSLVAKMEEAGLDCDGLFLHDPKRTTHNWLQYDAKTEGGIFKAVGNSPGAAIDIVKGFRFSWKLSAALQTEKRDWMIGAIKWKNVPPSPHQIVAHLDQMWAKTREAYLARHPENRHLWENKDSYLNPVV